VSSCSRPTFPIHERDRPPEFKLKICVVGAGAIGGLVGAWFARAGNEVCLVARGAHLDALRGAGLTLNSEGGKSTFAVRASTEPGDFGVQDAVFICLKAYSIAAMLPRLKSVVGPETIVIPAINGLPWWYFYKEGGRFDGGTIDCLDPGGGMFAALHPKHIIGCVVHAAAEVTAPGVISHTAGRQFIVGEPDRIKSARVQRLAAAMDAAGFEKSLATDIRVDIWTKLIGNLSYNPVAALALAYMHEINRNEGLLALIRALMAETMRVAEAYGVRVPMTLEERIGVARKLGVAKISMHQDIEKRRPLEIDAVIGAVVELARRSDIAVPTIDAVYALIAERARHLDR
jgi:2-dehydropantoate 2-reductase